MKRAYKRVIAVLLVMALMLGAFPIVLAGDDNVSLGYDYEDDGNISLGYSPILPEVQAFMPTSGFTTTPMISAGGHHTVALREDGTVWTCVQFI